MLRLVLAARGGGGEMMAAKLAITAGECCWHTWGRRLISSSPLLSSSTSHGPSTAAFRVPFFFAGSEHMNMEMMKKLLETIRGQSLWLWLNRYPGSGDQAASVVAIARRFPNEAWEGNGTLQKMVISS